MTKWLMVGVVIVIFLVGGYFLLGQNKSTAPATSPIPTESQPSLAPTASTQTATPSEAMKATNENTITLTAGAFSPATLTVKAGTKVTWVNKSGSTATVNSDPHPTHTNYSPLNLGRFSNGENLSLVFDKPGTYGYHNHLDATERGTVIVK